MRNCSRGCKPSDARRSTTGTWRSPATFRITRFAEYRGVLDPPSGVHDETVLDVERAIRRGGALLAWDGETLAGAARYEPRSE